MSDWQVTAGDVSLFLPVDYINDFDGNNEGFISECHQYCPRLLVGYLLGICRLLGRCVENNWKTIRRRRQASELFVGGCCWLIRLKLTGNEWHTPGLTLGIDVFVAKVQFINNSLSDRRFVRPPRFWGREYRLRISLKLLIHTELDWIFIMRLICHLTYSRFSLPIYSSLQVVRSGEQ